MLMRNTVFTLCNLANEEEIRSSIEKMVTEVQKYVPGYRLKQEVQFERSAICKKCNLKYFFNAAQLSVFDLYFAKTIASNNMRNTKGTLSKNAATTCVLLLHYALTLQNLQSRGKNFIKARYFSNTHCSNSKVGKGKEMQPKINGHVEFA